MPRGRLYLFIAGILLLMVTAPARAELPMAPPNDNFANAAAIGSVPFTTSADLTTASPEEGEPACFVTALKTIWYSITLPERSDAEFRVSAGGVAGAAVSVYSGSSVGALTTVAGCSTHSVRVSLQPGRTYYVQVAKHAYDYGRVTLSVKPLTGLAGRVTDEHNAPLDNICVEATKVPEDVDPGDVDYGYAETDAAGGYRILGITPGRYRVAFYDCRPRPQYLYEFYNDKHVWEDADLVTVVEDRLTYDVDASLAQAAAITGTITGEDDGPTAGVCVNAVDADTGTPTGWASVAPDGTYRVYVAGGRHKLRFGCNNYYVDEWYDDRPDFESATAITTVTGQETTGVDAVLGVRPIPANDGFANATTIGSLPFDTTVDLRRASTEENEPLPCGTSMNASVWFTYTASRTGSVIMNTYDSGVQPVLGVYTGESLQMLKNVACNHTNARGSKQIAFAATQGVTYYVQVAGSFVWDDMRLSVDEVAGTTPVELNAPTPCLALCPYWEGTPGETAAELEATCAAEPASPGGSWDDVRVTVPETVTAPDGHTGAPTHLTFMLAPDVDHDGWICAADGEERFVASAANTTSDMCAVGPIGCKEQATIPVTPGETLVLRVYNWSDPNADPMASYGFKVAR
jgi:hypothetical protein